MKKIYFAGKILISIIILTILIYLSFWLSLESALLISDIISIKFNKIFVTNFSIISCSSLIIFYFIICKIFFKEKTIEDNKKESEI